VAFELQRREYARLGEAKFEAQRNLTHSPSGWAVVAESGGSDAHRFTRHLHA
jgi:hypothetical protein